MNYKELEILKNAQVGWYPHEQKWYSSGELRLPEYEVKLPRVYFNTIEEAVKDLKERIAKAVTEFDPLLK